MIRRQRQKLALILGPAAVAVALIAYGLTLWWITDENQRLRNSGLQFENRAQDLLSTIGFVGMIHDFKNCVLRAQETEYCSSAEANAERALVLIAELQSLADDLEIDVELEALTRTVQDYRARIELVRQAHAEGRSIGSIDDEVRYNDAAAAAAINTTLNLARRTLESHLERLQWLSLLHTLGGMLTVLALAGWFIAAIQRENRRARDREARLNAVLSAVYGGLIGLNAAGRVMMANETGARMIGAEGLTAPYDWPRGLSLLHSDRTRTLDPADDPIRRTLSGEDVHGEVFLLKRADDDNPDCYVRISSARLDPGAADFDVVLLLDDVTDQERYRQQIERNSRLDALGQLSGGIAHDFNNLLATILYAITLALKEEHSDRSRKLLEQATRSVGRGRDLTSRLLAFGGRQPGLTRSRPVGDVFHDFEALARPAIEASIALHLETPDPELIVHCDQSQLENALLNLALNSRDAIRESGQGSLIRVTARGVTTGNAELRRRQRATSARPDGSDGLDFRFVEISVIDDGPGMSAEVRRRATDPFFTTKAAAEGTGLGLAMAYGFVRQANGEMQIYSDEGHGTTIRLILPRGTVDDAREPPVGSAELPRGRGETVLLVEDQPELLKMMSDVLKELGYEVVGARSGPEALHRIEAGLAFDVLLTDMVMPGQMDGLTLARRIRRTHGYKPVLLMSGYAERMEDENEGLEFPLLQKPCMPEDLAAALRRACEGTV